MHTYLLLTSQLFRAYLYLRVHRVTGATTTGKQSQDRPRFTVHSHFHPSNLAVRSEGKGVTVYPMTSNRARSTRWKEENNHSLDENPELNELVNDNYSCIKNDIYNSQMACGGHIQLLSIYIYIYIFSNFVAFVFNLCHMTAQ